MTQAMLDNLAKGRAKIAESRAAKRAAKAPKPETVGSDDTIPLALPVIGAIESLSRVEQVNLREPLFEALRTIFEGSDNLISKTNARKVEAYIWQEIDDEDTYFLVDALIRSGARVPVVGTAVRTVTHAHKLLRAGVILMPRFIATVKHYSDNGGFVLALW